jgi:pyruvate/2-oxoglutarate dehydrogenase complex dihydrolipoamide acyltransferase (E2) component
MTMQRNWNGVCQRLGVQPRQFGALLAVLGVSVGVLVAKFSFGPANASASTQAPAAASPPAASAPAPSAPTKVTAPAKRPVIRAELPQSCERDPFHLWMLPDSAPATAPVQIAALAASAPGVLPGLALKAVVRGELAVFGDQTARVGDAVELPDGSFAEVRSIGDRTVQVAWDGRTLDIRLGAGNGSSRAPAAGGFK